MSLLEAALLGLVEGLTEYLPVSSTGHLVLVSHFFGQDGEASAAFDIVIQLGAILAVVVQYRALLAERARGLLRRDSRSQRLLVALALGFLPAAVTGLVLRKTIKAHLFGPTPVALALIVGGVVMIVAERLMKGRAQANDSVDDVTPKRALIIGGMQCLAMWPGASRSMCTILGGQVAGLSTKTAAEFSFLLGLPTLGAATLYEAYKSKDVLFADGAVMPLVVGLVVSFFVAWAVIAAFIRYLSRRGLEPFGVYRIALGIFVLLLVR
ncbi:MAG: undecaprenyl-diphosphate phosphatase [Deltaproteobacteria bacterium]|nr:undecaprenyl-diphosphate phosphatase [Deltaproteobacteria bacterium]